MLTRIKRSWGWLGTAALLLAPALANAQEQAPAPPPPDAGAAQPVAPMVSPAPAATGVAHVGACGAMGGCRSGACAPWGGVCQNGACANGWGTPCSSGMCFGAPGSCMSPEAMAGRPYTFGDLHADMHSMKCRMKDGFCDGTNCDSCALKQWWANECYKNHCRNEYSRSVWGAHFHNKFNYFNPSGCCGAGCPPFGIYKRVYAAQPDYMDRRDGQIYAAPATGVPTAVPMAPVVRHQMNYGWGTPSSRLTPISNFVRPQF